MARPSFRDENVALLRAEKALLKIADATTGASVALSVAPPPVLSVEPLDEQAEKSGRMRAAKASGRTTVIRFIGKLSGEGVCRK
jgi:hypothetical protein